jgi:AAHS family 3-hydroxyphenylpropionic acid transporter
MKQTDTAGQTQRFWLTIAICFAVGMAQAFALAAPSVSAVQLREAFMLTPARLGAAFSAGTFGLLLGAVGGGTLSDRIGRKTTQIIATLCFGLGSIGTGFATGFDTLLLSRLVVGTGIGATLANLIAITSQAAPTHQRSRAIAVLIVGMQIGGAIACVMAGWKLMLENWRLLYFVGGGFPLLLVPALLLLPAMKPQHRGGVVDKVRIGELLGDRAPGTLMLWTASFLLMISIYIFSNWLPSLLQARGLDHETTLLVQVLVNLGGIAGALTSGWLLDRPPAGRSAGIAALYIGYLISILLMAAAPAQPAVLLGLGALIGAMLTAVASVLHALAPALYPVRMRGTGVGMGVATGRIGSIIGPLFAGMLLSSGFSATTVLVAMVPPTALAALCAIMIGRIAARNPVGE